MSRTGVTSVLVYGTGSIGAMLAYLLSTRIPQENIYTVCRSNYVQAAQKGFTINSDIWGSGLTVRPTVVRSVEEAVKRNGPFDYILVTTKATPDCAEGRAIRPAACLSPNTAIVILQNGIAIEESFGNIFPDNPIISGVLYTPVSQTGPTTYEHGYLDDILLGTFPAEAPISHKEAAKGLVQLLLSGGATAEYVADIQIERWRKLLINGSENPICALCGLRDAEFFQSVTGAIPLMKDVMSEIAATARAEGYRDLSESMVVSTLNILTQRPLPGVMPSMMADSIAGRQMEVGAILGNTVKLAQKHGVPTPLLNALLILIVGLNKSIAKMSRLNGSATSIL